jgi:hypothetical protein
VLRSRYIRRRLRRRWGGVASEPRREEYGVWRVIRRSRARRRRSKRRPDRACRMAWAVSYSHYDNGSESIDVGSEGFRSSSVAGGQDQRQDFYRRPAQGDEDVLQVSGRCAPRSSARERPGAILVASTRTEDVDAVARTWWPPSKLRWTRRAICLLSARRGILPAQRVQLLLALDAIGSPGPVHGAAVAAVPARPSRAVVEW